MTNEKILESLYAAAKQFKDFDVVMSILRKEGGKAPTCCKYLEPDFIICELILKLENETKEKAMKKAGKSDLLGAAKNILKYAQKHMPYKPLLHKAYMCNGYQVVCDSFRALIIDESKKLDIDTNTEKQMDVIKTIPDNPARCSKVPDIAILKAEIERFKNLYGKKIMPVLRFLDENGQLATAFNPDFFMDIIKGTGAKEFYYNTATSLSLFKGDGVKGLLCPINTLTNQKHDNKKYYIDVDFSGAICITVEELAA